MFYHGGWAMKTRGLLFIVCALAVVSTNSFSAVGTWRNFTSMKDVRGVARDGTTYWAATDGGLFGWNSADDTYQLFTNAEGLQSTNLSAVGIDAQGNIWTGTPTGTIHVYSQQHKTWRYISDIATSEEINKRINSFTMLGDTVFMCTDFAMFVFRIGSFGFGDKYSQFGSLRGNTRVSVSSAVVFNDSLWLTISDGQNTNRVAVASLATPNLLPPESWNLLTVDNAAVIPRQLAVFNGKLYAATNSGLYVYTSGNWNIIPTLSGQNVVALSSSATLLGACTPNNVFTIDLQENVVQVGNGTPFIANQITSNASGQPIVASKDGGLLTFDTAWTSHAPNGPNSNLFLSVAVNIDGSVWGASGFSGNGKGIYRYNGTNWKSFTAQNSLLPTNDYYRVSTGCNGSVWASAYGWGIAEIPLGVDSILSSRIFGTNVGMIGIPSAPEYIVTSTAACDGFGNTWMTVVAAADKRIQVVRKANGSWATYPVSLNGVPFTTFMDRQVDRCLAIDAYGSLWSCVRQDGLLGVVTMGNRGEIGDTLVAYHLTANDGLPSNGVTTIVVDLDGQVWIGTDDGIGIVVDPQNPKRAGGIANYAPLRQKLINCIAVDALNQKWIGTPDGVFVYSPDGTQQLASYTVASTEGKLISDDVKSIAIDGNTGTIYFGTLSGLASLTTVAAAPKLSFDKLLVSPNPFIIPVASQAIIDGLVENTTLKILSIDGRLVRQIKSPGGRIGFWDGKDEEGTFVASGVYLIVASSDKDEKVATGKIAVIRR